MSSTVIPRASPCSGRQSNPPHVGARLSCSSTSMTMSSSARCADTVHRRQGTVEMNIHHAAAYRNYRTLIVHMGSPVWLPLLPKLARLLRMHGTTRHQRKIVAHHINRDRNRDQNHAYPESPAPMNAFPGGRIVIDFAVPLHYRGARSCFRSLLSTRGTIRPFPVPDFRQVLTVFIDVMLMLDQLVLHHLLQVGALGTQVGTRSTTSCTR